MIAVQNYIQEMTKHWTKTLGNVVSTNLQLAWAQIAEAFNAHIQSHDDPESIDKWTVLSPPTGSGKSQGTAVYCSMLCKQPIGNRVGTLIVTRLKSDADAMAETINTLAGERCAIAYHTDSREIPLTDLWQFDVVVITHKAYELALDKLGAQGQLQQTWEFFHQYGNDGDTRKLVVIDESLDIIEESQGNLEGLRQTLAVIPDSLRETHSYAIEGIKALITILEEISKTSQGVSTKETLLVSEEIKAGNPPNLTALRADLRNVRFDLQNHKSDLYECERLRQIHDARLKQLDAIFRSWSYYAKVPSNGHTLNTARLLVPENTKGAVVLDATAIHDVIYELFDRVEPIEPPIGVRDYSNVNLFISKGHKQGKVYLRNHGKEECSKLVNALTETLPKNSNVFVCCHKDTEAILKTYDPEEFKLNVGHYGAVDGSNAWRDCDTAVIFGLPYLPDTWSANAYFALQGVKTTEWLQSQDRPHGKHLDIREALKTGHIVSSVVQAINRIRCRKVIDSKGNCPKSNIYLMLPNGVGGEAILEGILKSMPSVNLKEWTFTGATRKIRKGNYDEALLTFANNMHIGKESSTNIKRALAINDSTWDRLVKKLSDNSSELFTKLLELGVTYLIERNGSRNVAYLAKS
jgi:hypothetical protein